ncbi:MAG: glycoside hydrolase family 5 protein [Oscillospiraceae bacterium]|nr:glycoside hydrolase family 5 protein [Oscillospiraceae bacterium]
MKNHKITILILSLAFLLPIVGCSSNSPDYRLPYVPLDHEMRDISSWDLVKEIQAGWNLGNTFDSSHMSGLDAETFWGNPRTTFPMIQAVANAGFDAVRIPITWQWHLGESPYYLICEEWLDRVEEIVGYVLATGMFCIINLHHEDWIIATPEHEQQTTQKLVAVWEQLSYRFRDYNEKLIFEGINEPRAIGCMWEWDGGSSEDRQVVNRLNLAFIDTVRASGGRNTLRHLMIPSYAASAEEVAMLYLSKAFPQEDDNRIIASIHAYTPYQFSLISGIQGVADWKPHEHGGFIDLMFDGLQKHFLDKGIPVILGETGARDRDGNLHDRVAWTRYYFGNARKLGVPAFWWDNGSVLHQNEIAQDFFGILDRKQAEFVFPEIVDAIMNR